MSGPFWHLVGNMKEYKFEDFVRIYCRCI